MHCKYHQISKFPTYVYLSFISLNSMSFSRSSFVDPAIPKVAVLAGPRGDTDPPQAGKSPSNMELGCNVTILHAGDLLACLTIRYSNMAIGNTPEIYK